MNEQDATTLARIVNGRPIQGGGDTWYVRIKCHGNRYISLDNTGLTEYRTNDPEGYDDGDYRKYIQHVEWEDARDEIDNFHPTK